MKSEDKRRAGREQRILCRLLAKELSPEEMKHVRGSEDRSGVSTAAVTNPCLCEDN